MTEVELSTEYTSEHDMLYTLQVLQCLEPKMGLSMLLEMDNKLEVDFASYWSFGGWTNIWHETIFSMWIGWRRFVLNEHVLGDENGAVLFAKNLTGSIFKDIKLTSTMNKKSSKGNVGLT